MHKMIDLDFRNVARRAQSEYRVCAGRDCKNFGTISLKINYIKRRGVFCDECAADLLQQGLASELELQ